MTSISLFMDVQILEIPMAVCGEDMLEFILFHLVDLHPSRSAPTPASVWHCSLRNSDKVHI